MRAHIVMRSQCCCYCCCCCCMGKRQCVSTLADAQRCNNVCLHTIYTYSYSDARFILLLFSHCTLQSVLLPPVATVAVVVLFVTQSAQSITRTNIRRITVIFLFATAVKWAEGISPEETVFTPFVYNMLVCVCLLRGACCNYRKECQQIHISFVCGVRRQQQHQCQ